MKVLVCCEYSGRVRDAFAALGHDAWSNDIMAAKGNHIQGDAFDAIESDEWDLIIMHPPCTALCCSGNRWYGFGKPKHAERLKAIEWTMGLWHHAIQKSGRVCMENPVGCLPLRPTQYVHPWEHGHGETKATGLRLYWLPPLQPSNIVPGRDHRIHKMPPSETRSMERSLTYQGIANAMADQWGGSI